MKKIFVILSVLSLFVGCASKPAPIIEEKKEISIEKDDSQIEVSEEAKMRFLNQRYFTKGYKVSVTNEDEYVLNFFNYNKKLQLKLMKEEYYRIINLSEISSSEWLRFTRINWKVPSSKNVSNNVFVMEDPNKEYRWDIWEADFLKDKKLENKNFTGKIINNSDETLEFHFLVREPNHYYQLIVLPHEEKYYSIPATENNIDFQMSVKPLNSKMKEKGLVNFGKEYMSYELSKYLYCTYSLELTYNGSEDIKTYYWDDAYYTDNWKLVKRYDIDENIPKELFPVLSNNGGK